MFNGDALKEPSLKEEFRIEIEVAKPLVVGQDFKNGRRQMIEITSGIVKGERISGKVQPFGIDSQIIRPDGFTELKARYAIELDSGESIYIENSGIRRVDKEVAKRVADGEIVDPKHVYFATVAKFETYSEKYRWLEESIFISYGIRLPKKVVLRFYRVV